MIKYILSICYMILWMSESSGAETKINKLIFNNNGIDAYSFEFETSDGTFRREHGGTLQKTGEETLVVRGEYGYVDPDGIEHIVKYIADENGFQPQFIDDVGIRFNDRNIL